MELIIKYLLTELLDLQVVLHGLKLHLQCCADGDVDSNITSSTNEKHTKYETP